MCTIMSTTYLTFSSWFFLVPYSSHLTNEEWMKKGMYVDGCYISMSEKG